MNISFAAVGDIMLARKVGELIQKRGPSFPFERTISYLKGGDIIFGNLECPISERGEKIKGKDEVFRASSNVIIGLVEAGFNFLSFANNHAMDYGKIAFLDTIKILKENGIKVVGAGNNINEATTPCLFEKENFRVALMGYTGSFGAGKNSPGYAPMRLSRIKNDIKKAKRNADIIIISLHWGLQFEKLPLPMYINFAHKLVEAGADLIIGHGPHVLQKIEKYKGKIIVYSLGNFIFDQEGEPQKSMILKCNLSRNGIQNLRLIPVWINENYQPEILIGKDGEHLLREINDPSFAKDGKTQEELEESFISGIISTVSKRGKWESFKYILTKSYKLPLLYYPLIIKYFLERLKNVLSIHKYIRK